ncbi:MAG: XdhC family protein [Alphaproteobacteria bacterium]
MERNLLIRLNAERALRRPALVATTLTTGASRLMTVDDAQTNTADDSLRAEFADRSRSGKSGLSADGGTFFTIHVPPPRLVVIGAVHISEALVPMARLAGFDVVVIDPRTAFAEDRKFHDAQVVAEWPEDALAARPLDAHTALAALTHDPKIDDLPLTAALEANCFYIGALGSRKTHGRRVERLLATGVTQAALDRIKAPIGLNIAAQSPAEIAVAILAELVFALRAAPGAAPPLA